MWLWHQKFSKCFVLVQCPWNVPFLWVFGLLLPQILFDLMKLWPETICNKKNTVSEKYFKILHFGTNGMQLKFTVLVHSGAKLTAGKPKILLKTNISAKTASLGIINNVSVKSQKNLRILGNLSQKTFFGPTLGLNCHHVSKAHQKFLHSL